jgi:hypothetical protein
MDMGRLLTSSHIVRNVDARRTNTKCKLSLIDYAYFQTLWDFSETSLRLLWDFSETPLRLLRLLWDFSETPLRFLWDFSETPLRLLWDFPSCESFVLMYYEQKLKLGGLLHFLHTNACKRKHAVVQVGWGTALQAGRSRVRFPIMSKKFFIYIILPAILWSWGWLSL